MSTKQILEAVAKALRAYKTDMSADDTEFQDIEIAEENGEPVLFVNIDGESVALSAEVF